MSDDTDHHENRIAEDATQAAQAISDVNVDLSADEQAESPEPNEVEAELRHDSEDDVPDNSTSEFEEEYGITEKELQGQVEQETKQRLQRTDAEGLEGAIKEAIEGLREEYQSTISRYRQLHQQIQEIEGKRANYEHTISRLEEIDDDEDRLVIRTHPGGVAEEVLPGERTVVGDQLEDERERLRERYEELADEAAERKLQLKKIELTNKELKRPDGVLSEITADILDGL